MDATNGRQPEGDRGWKKTRKALQERRAWLKRIPTPAEIRLKEVYKRQDFEHALADLLSDKQGNICVFKFWNAMRNMGLHPNDPRLKECQEKFRAIGNWPWGAEEVEEEELIIDKETFLNCITDNIFLVGRAFKKDLVIPEFRSFTQEVEKIFLKCKKNTSGQVSRCIPQLSRVNPDYWGMSICTIDGQRASFGDFTVPFVLQACSRALNYVLALNDCGLEIVHNHVGFEPSGGAYNEIVLNDDNKPYNPFVNTGAITTVSLIKPKMRMADRFDWVFSQYRRLAGGGYVSYNNASYLSERSSVDRNYAIAHHLKEASCFPTGTSVQDTLQFYQQLNSVEVTTESASVIAATLANGGVCPITGENVVSTEAVRNTLSVMHSCGVNEHSGHFAFQVGLPAKSGVSGAVLLVVPRVMGICCWSPRLETEGNSCRGLQFAEELVRVFNFHNYGNFISQANEGLKMDPRRKKFDGETPCVLRFLFGAATGDVSAIHRISLSGMNLEAQDFDNRTALHVAAAEGHLGVVRMLIEQRKVQHNPKDRWGFTPLDDAVRFEREPVVAYLKGVQDPPTIPGTNLRRSAGVANISAPKPQTTAKMDS